MLDFRLISCITLYNVVHPHFPWLRPKTGMYCFALPQQYAGSGIVVTESEGEPIMCGMRGQPWRCPGTARIHSHLPC